MLAVEGLVLVKLVVVVEELVLEGVLLVVVEELMVEGGWSACKVEFDGSIDDGSNVEFCGSSYGVGSCDVCKV